MFSDIPRNDAEPVHPNNFVNHDYMEYVQISDDRARNANQEDLDIRLPKGKVLSPLRCHFQKGSSDLSIGGFPGSIA